MARGEKEEKRGDGGDYGRIIYTPRFLGLLFTIAFVAATTILYNPSIPYEFYYIVAVVLGYMSAMYLLIELSSRLVYRLRVVRTVDKPLIEGKPATVRVRIENPSYLPVLYIEVSDRYPSLFKLVKGASYISGLLLGKGFIETRYIVEPRIGSHLFEGIEVLLKDPLGLFTYKAVIPGSGMRVYVHPQPYPIPRRLMARWISTSLGLTKSRLRGIGNEFLTLREYVFGDDYRFIDWKSYARLRRLYVKVFERESSLNLMLVLDASPAMLYGVISRTMLEESIRVISGIAANTLERGDWVGLLVRSREPMLLRQDRGRIQYSRLLRELSRIEWARDYPSYTMADLLMRSFTVIPRRSKNIFLVFMSLDPNAYPSGVFEKEIEDLINIHYKLSALSHTMVIVSPLPELYEVRYLTGIEAALYTAISYRSIEAARRYARELQRHGIRVLNVGPSSLLPRIIRFIESYRSVVS